MKKLFKPHEILDIFTDFDIDAYWDRGYRLILLDIDNTIAIPDTGHCDDRAKQFIKKLQDKGFEVVIFSNNNKERVESFVDGVDVKYHYMAMKPLPFSYRSIAKKYCFTPKQTVVLGDQLMTDVLGANLSGCTGIYCKKIQEKDTPLTSINRKMENIVWRYILHEKV